MMRETRDAFAKAVISSPLIIVLLVLGLIPLGTLVLTSLWRNTTFGLDRTLTFENYQALIEGDSGTVFQNVLWSSFGLTIIVTALALVIGFPTAYVLSQKVGRGGSVVLLLLYIPLSANYLVKIYAWRGLLDNRGLINYTLTGIGLIDQPITWLLYNQFAVGLALLSAILPLVIMPIYTVLIRLPRNLIEAAADLGGGQFYTLRTVVLPLASRGILAGATFSVVACLGDFVASQFLGGTSGLMVGRIIYGYFGLSNNAPQGAAMGVVVIVLTLFVVGMLALLSRRVGGGVNVPLDGQLTR